MRVDTLSEAIALGVSKRDHAFSIYIPRHIREDLKCLLVHFTLDSKLILGVSVDEKNSLGEDNLPFAK